MEANAIAKFIHMSPRKIRLVADLVRDLSVVQARKQLAFSKKAAAKPVLKVVNSAIANAGDSVDLENVFVKEIFVDEGPTIKRYMPRAHGRSAPIRKRTSHISVTIGDKEEKTVTQEK